MSKLLYALAVALALALPSAAFADPCYRASPQDQCIPTFVPVGPTGTPQSTQGAINTPITYAQVSIATSSTLLLAAAATSRSMLETTNLSGRFSGTATDVWCNYAVAAVLGQGFPIYGGGGQYNRNLPAAIDLRAINCIASATTTINVGSVQQ